MFGVLNKPNQRILLDQFVFGLESPSILSDAPSVSVCVSANSIWHEHLKNIDNTDSHM